MFSLFIWLLVRAVDSGSCLCLTVLIVYSILHALFFHNFLYCRVSTIYVNLTQQNASGSFHIPPPPTDVLSPENTKEDSKTNSKNYILPNTHTHGQKCTRAVIGIMVGLFLGCVMFAALSLAYRYSFVESAAVSGGITLVMCVFLVISPHARCVAALMSVSVFTGQGRTAFLSLIPGLLFAGPVTNMHRNFNEVHNNFTLHFTLISMLIRPVGLRSC